MNTMLETSMEIGPILSQYINEEENNRRLSQPVFNVLGEAGCHKLFLPKSLGGLEADPLTAAKRVEEVASYNTAAGWSMMVANTSAWWCNWLPEKGIDETWKRKPDTFIAGAFHPPMMAMQTDDGYIINGKSPLTSNVHEADRVFVSALVMENEKVKMNNGMPEIIGVFMDRYDCEIIDTWHTIGMRATDSNDIAAKNVFVPNHLVIHLGPGLQSNKYFSGPLYRFPAIGINTASLIAPVALAIARNAINEVKLLAGKKTPFASAVPMQEKGSIQRKVGMAEAIVQSARAFLHQTITYCWNKTLAGEKVSLEEKTGLLLAATHTNQTCLNAIDMMYAAAGSSAIYTRSKLAHYFADAQVIRQHGFANESRYETAAQVYLGLQPDLPVLMF